MHEKIPHIKKAIFRNNIQDVPTLGEFIDGIAEEENIDVAVVGGVNLALEEAVVNVMNYAYPKGDEGHIELESAVTPEKWEFKLLDTGKPFDPTKVADADVTLDVEDRPVGGLGIFLVRQIMDSLEYKRDGNKNVLTMIKKLI